MEAKKGIIGKSRLTAVLNSDGMRKRIETANRITIETLLETSFDVYMDYRTSRIRYSPISIGDFFVADSTERMLRDIDENCYQTVEKLADELGLRSIEDLFIAGAENKAIFEEHLRRAEVEREFIQEVKDRYWVDFNEGELTPINIFMEELDFYPFIDVHTHPLIGQEVVIPSAADLNYNTHLRKKCLRGNMRPFREKDKEIRYGQSIDTRPISIILQPVDEFGKRVYTLFFASNKNTPINRTINLIIADEGNSQGAISKALRYAGFRAEAVFYNGNFCGNSQRIASMFEYK